MFYAIDVRTNEIVLSINIEQFNYIYKVNENFKNVRENCYKDTYNNKLRFRCADSNCNDNKLIYVNSYHKTPHFRHSINDSNCSAKKNGIEFNHKFYDDWFKLFKNEYRKPYWYNIKLEDIQDDKQVIMIRYSKQSEDKIKSIENYSKTKINWILSIENRKFSNILNIQDKIYIDFTGYKNEIPLFDLNKSNVYLDTGFNYLLKIKDNYRYEGQEIEIIDIIDFCNENEYLFKAYPYRQKSNYYKNFIDIKNDYINDLNDYNNKLDKYNNYKSLENFINLCKRYDKLSYEIKRKLYNNTFYYYKIKIDIILNLIKNYIEDIGNKRIELDNNYDNSMNIIKEIKGIFKFIDIINKQKELDNNYDNSMNIIKEIKDIYKKIFDKFDEIKNIIIDFNCIFKDINNDYLFYLNNENK